MDVKGVTKFITLLEQLALRVSEMDKKLDEIRTNHVSETKTDIAVLKNKVSRLEWIIYGCIALIMTEGMALIFSFIKHG